MRSIYQSSYTGEQLDAAIAAILGLDMSNYFTSSEVESIFRNYSTTSEMQKTIETEISKIDLSDYAKSSDVRNAILEELSGLDLSEAVDARLVEYVKNDVLNSTLQSYYTKSETNSAITNEIGKIDLSVYAKTSALAEYATNDSVTNALKSYSTTSEMNSAITNEIGKINLSVYAKTEALADYAEKDDVYSKTEIDNKLSVTEQGITAQVSQTVNFNNNQMYQWVQGKLALTIVDPEDGDPYSVLAANVGKIVFDAGQIEINSDNFTLTPDGDVSITGIINALVGGTVGAFCITEDGLSLDPVFAGNEFEVSLIWDNLPGLIVKDATNNRVYASQYRASGISILRPNIVDGGWFALSDGTNTYQLYLDTTSNTVKFKTAGT